MLNILFVILVWIIQTPLWFNILATILCSMSFACQLFSITKEDK